MTKRFGRYLFRCDSLGEIFLLELCYVLRVYQDVLILFSPPSPLLFIELCYVLEVFKDMSLFSLHPALKCCASVGAWNTLRFVM